MKVYPINLYSNVHKIYDNVFVSKKNVELNSSSGAVFSSLDALANYNISFSGINKPKPEDSTAVSIYAVDKDGNYKKYSSIKAAARELGATDSNISKCLKGKQNTAAGHGFLYASEVEILGKNGNYAVDRRKIEKKRLFVEQVLSSLPVIRPFYAVDSEGNYTKYERNRDAMKDLGISHSCIARCLNGERDTSGGYAFVYADEVETDDGNGNVIVNINIPQEKFGQRTPVPIYSINEKGQLRKYLSVGAAASAVCAPRRNVEACLKNERETAMGYAFVRADELEVKDKKGKVFLNQDIIEEKFRQVVKHAIYVVDAKGVYTRYDSYSKASDELGISEASLLFCANGVQKGVNGYTVIKASYVETLKDGKVVINRDLLKKFAQEAHKLAPRAVVALDENKHRQKFADKKAAAEALGLNLRGIANCLTGKQKTTGGYSFVYEDEIVKRKRKPFMVYALDRGGEVHEFKSLDEAAQKLNVDKEEIEIFLRKGTTRDKKTTLNGYVFSTANDE
ncbi:MAG: NUMOD1 domain-containing DNA-binding protein [Candidatus Avigastranaerophilus sp.]